MWSTALIGAGTLLTALFVAWPLLGESVLPLSGAVLYLRLFAALLFSFALIVWDVRRRHALAAYALIAPDLRGRAATRILNRVVAEPPEAAGRGLAEIAHKAEGAEALARKEYIDSVVPRLLARPAEALTPGARAMLKALA